MSTLSQFKPSSDSEVENLTLGLPVAVEIEEDGGHVLKVWLVVGYVRYECECMDFQTRGANAG